MGRSTKETDKTEERCRKRDIPVGGLIGVRKAPSGL